MAFTGVWTRSAQEKYSSLRAAAEQSLKARVSDRKRKKAFKAEGLFKQVYGCIQKLLDNPRHPGLRTHKYSSLTHPYDSSKPVFEAYVQNNTPGAYRVFWCYGPDNNEITILAITPHP